MTGRALLAGLLLLLGIARAAAASDPETVAEPLTGIIFVAVPGGCFEMGDIAVGVVGQVCLDPFLIGRTEVTNAQYVRLVPDHAAADRSAADLPVVNVSHAEAVAFAASLGERSGWPVRLPSEAEWEYAARAGSTTARHWGAAVEPAHLFANLMARPGDYRIQDPFEARAPVASFAPNDFGLYDMLGNVAEWVADSYVAGAERYGEARENPVVLSEAPLKVRRGGSFADPASLVRSAARDFYAGAFALPQTGFRLVLEPMVDGPDDTTVGEKEE